MTTWFRAGVALVVLSLATACGGSGGDVGDVGSSGPPAVTCGFTSNGGQLIVNNPMTCGTAISTPNEYTFSAEPGTIYTVTLVTTSGDADLGVFHPSVALENLIALSLNEAPPNWVDAVSFTSDGDGGVYYIRVGDFPGTGSSYGIEVTTP
jgi:hypothetical protein